MFYFVISSLFSNLTFIYLHSGETECFVGPRLPMRDGKELNRMVGRKEGKKLRMAEVGVYTKIYEGKTEAKEAKVTLNVVRE